MSLMRAYTPLFLTNIIERDDGKKKQIMEKAIIPQPLVYVYSAVAISLLLKS